MSNNKSKSNKGLKALAITLAAILVVGATYTGLSVGLNSWNPADWVNHTEEVQPEGQVSGGGAIIDETKSNGVRLASATIAVADYDEYGISPLAETAYTLTATVYDEDSSSDGIPQDVIYTAEWQNPSSEWATGKDIADYYTVTSTGVNTATATCLQAFGEPIVITATSYFNEDAYCTWEANYVKRVNNLTLTVTGSNFLWDDSSTFTVDTAYGVGTVQGELVFSGMRIELGSQLVQKISNNNAYYDYFLEQAGDNEHDWSGEATINIGPYTEEDLESENPISFGANAFFFDNMGYNSPELNALMDATNNLEYFGYAILHAASQTSGDLIVYIQCDYTYNGEEYYSSMVKATNTLEIVGDYPQPANVTGNDVDLIY